MEVFLAIPLYILRLLPLSWIRLLCRLLGHGIACPDVADQAGRRLQQILRAYFRDPVEFGRALEDAGALLSGSTVLWVAVAGRWAPGDLDVVVASGSAPGFCAFLTSQGFELVGEAEDDAHGEYPTTGDFVLRTYTHPLTDARVDVSIPRLHSPTAFIGRYHSTMVMNWFDGSHLIVMHPALTFRHVYLSNPDRLAPTSSAAWNGIVDKYRQRGFRYIGDLPVGWASHRVRRWITSVRM